ncbi:slit homolog 1 protein-like [Pollicipes pollicipes]|uniref:slit homolog 1 protein-like n=1 Tax=Pollicipes pollicipes TaxID=41117 RepID=UPI0018849DA4|nr:slit homolog 1 protein-like [Pollicipes pollicipes]
MGPLLQLWLAALLCVAVAGFPCPSGCVCPSEIQVLCTNAGLTSPPRHLSPYVQHLSLAGNRIRRIGISAFQRLRRLRTLVLDDNEIGRIAPFAFLGLRDLERLSIQRNPLGELGRFALAGLHNVTYLYLSPGGVRRVRPFAFAGTADVKLLLLSGNPAAELEPDGFSGLRRVDHLLLEDSDLGTLERGWLAGLRQVGRLSLRANTIHELAALNVTSEVRRLDFHGNRVLSVPAGAELALAPTVEASIEGNLFPCTCQVHRVLAALSRSNYSEVRFMQDNFCLTPPSLHKRRISEANVTQIAPCPDRDRAEEEERRKSEEVRLPSSVGRLFSAPLPAALLAVTVVRLRYL